MNARFARKSTMKCDFNPQIFSQNFHDYLIINELSPDKTIFLANFTPLNILCTVRLVTTLSHDRELYENECYINQKLEHPNLLKVYQNFFLGQALVSVLPFCEFGTVEDFVRPTFGVSEPITSLVLSDVLKAVDYLHQNMIIHRAIKGTHIHIVSTGNESVQFLLGGMKYSLDMSDSTQLQSHDYPLYAGGILQSMAPEIFEQNTIGYNYKADIYSIGLLCCEMSNGFIPFSEAQTDELLLCKILGNQPLLLDSTLISPNWIALKKSFADFKIDNPERLKKRHEKYTARKYSERFRDFVSNGCLHIEPARRLSAPELLAHTFMITQTDRTDFYRMLKKIIQN